MCQYLKKTFLSYCLKIAYLTVAVTRSTSINNFYTLIALAAAKLRDVAASAEARAAKSEVVAASAAEREGQMRRMISEQVAKQVASLGKIAGHLAHAAPVPAT